MSPPFVLALGEALVKQQQIDTMFLIPFSPVQCSFHLVNVAFSFIYTSSDPGSLVLFISCHCVSEVSF